MSNIKIVNLSTYTAPKITETKNKDFVSYGEDNNYYQYLRWFKENMRWLLFTRPSNNTSIL